MSVKTLVLWGEGINSHQETKQAFELAGSRVDLVHVKDFLRFKSLEAWDILCFPGGFSYGDEVRSGKILAQKIIHHQQENIQKFKDQDKPILGICNGFQILVQLGLFNHNKRVITLTQNKSEKFINLWVKLKVNPSDSFWLRDLPEELYMPIRHKEGRFLMKGQTDCHLALTYQQDINGSDQFVAGITSDKGNVLGLMPHPEAGIHPFQLPHQEQMYHYNRQIFINAINYVKRKK